MADTDTTSQPGSIGDGFDADPSDPTVSALHTSPDRILLTEDGNTDGWLASDVSFECHERR